MTETTPVPPPRPWQVGGALFALLFAYSAVVNLNDADAALWVLLYGAGAIAAVLDITGRLRLGIATLMGTLYVAAAALMGLAATGGSQDMKGFPQVGIFTQELVREALGLGLVGLWIGVVAIRLWRSPTRPT